MVCETRLKLAEEYSKDKSALAEAVAAVSDAVRSWRASGELIEVEKAARERVRLARETLIGHILTHDC